jgi:hypothetical protein
VVVPAIVLLLCSAVVLVGVAAEVRDTVRSRRTPAMVPSGGTDVPERTPADVGRWPMLAWLGLAAFAVLATAAVANREPDVDDLTLVVVLLGFAGDRAFYLVRRRHSGDNSALGGEVVALVVGAIGLLVGLTI